MTRSEIQLPKDVIRCTSLKDAIEILSRSPFDEAVETVFVIGGERVFGEAMADRNCVALHVTRIEGGFDCDVRFPEIPHGEFKIFAATAPIREAGSSCRCSFLVYTREGQHEIEFPPATAAKHEEIQVHKMSVCCHVIVVFST